MRHFLLSLLALLGVSTMASATEATIVGAVELEQEESSTGVYDLSSYISSSDNLTITAGESYSITFTAVGTVSGTETTATYTTSNYSAQTIPTLIALTSGWYIDETEHKEAISWDDDAPTSLTLEGEGIIEVKVGDTQISVGMSYPSYVDLSSAGDGEPSVLALLQGTVTDEQGPNPTTYELLELTIVFTSPADHTRWSNVQVGGMYKTDDQGGSTWLCTATLVTEAGGDQDQTAVITCEELKAAFEAALQSSSISNKTIDYSNFTGLQIQVNGTVIKSVSYTYGTPATEELEPETPANIGWSFDDEAFASLQDVADSGNLSSDFITEDGFKITVGDGTVKYQTNGASVMVGTDETGEPILYTPSYRLQMGSGSAGTKACIGVPVEGACTLYVVAASSGDAGRYVMVSDGETVLNADEENSSFVVAGKDYAATTNCLFSVDYEDEAKELYIYSKLSSINFFYIYVSYDGEAPDFTSASGDDEQDTEGDGEEGTLEDFVLDIADCVTNSNVNIWSEDCKPTVNDDGTSVDVAFANTWAGFGFIQPSWASWDLTDYEAAEMTYEFETGYTPTAYIDYVTFQLQTAGSKAYVVSEPDYENTGKITLVFADHTVGTYTDWNNGGTTKEATMDYSDINQIGVQASTAFNITIKEIRFIVKYTAAGVEDEDEGIDTAIETVKSDVEVTEVARYNLMGQKISGAERGINIIVYSDGSAKKVLVK